MPILQLFNRCEVVSWALKYYFLNNVYSNNIPSLHLYSILEAHNVYRFTKEMPRHAPEWSCKIASSNPGNATDTRGQGGLHSLHCQAATLPNHWHLLFRAMRKGVDSAVLQVFYTLLLEQAVWKYAVGWLCLPQRKRVIALAIGWRLAHYSGESRRMGWELNTTKKKT